jgi:hypothetical protein
MARRILIATTVLACIACCDSAPAESACPDPLAESGRGSGSMGSDDPLDPEPTLASGTSGDAETGEIEPAAPQLPNPRWILWDADGNAVSALISPLCEPSDSGACGQPPDFFEPWSYNCVYVGALGNTTVSIKYDLSTGLIGECAKSQLSLGHIFADPDCTGQEYAAGAWAGYGGRALFLRDSAIHYAQPSGVVQLDPAYGFYPTGLPDGDGLPTCAALPYGPQQAYPLVPLPEEIVNLLDNPPYTIELVY